MDFRDKNILFLVHSYHSFQKDQIEYLSKYFGHVYVLVRYKPIAEIARFLPLAGGKLHTSDVVFNLKNKPENVTVIPLPLWYLPFDFIYSRIGDYAFRKANQIIRANKIQFDLIFSFFLWTSGYIGNRLKEEYKVPHVTSGRGGDVYDYPFRNALWRKNTLDTLNKADVITTVSNRNAACIKKLGCEREVRVVPNGFFEQKSFPVETAEVRRKLGLPVDKQIILSVGALVKIKGHRFLIEAMATVRKRHPDALCLIVGDGKLSKSYGALIRDLGLQDHVKLLGYKKNDEINEWINAADLFVLPSLGEGYPNVMNECLACGKPFIGSDVGSIPDIIKHSEVGFVCRPADSEDLAQKIETALAKKWNREYILEFAQNLSYENVAKQYLEIFEKLIR